jgi:hypothetical protein
MSTMGFVTSRSYDLRVSFEAYDSCISCVLVCGRFDENGILKAAIALVIWIIRVLIGMTVSRCSNTSKIPVDKTSAELYMPAHCKFKIL